MFPRADKAAGRLMQMFPPVEWNQTLRDPADVDVCSDVIVHFGVCFLFPNQMSVRVIWPSLSAKILVCKCCG